MSGVFSGLYKHSEKVVQTFYWVWELPGIKQNGSHQTRSLTSSLSFLFIVARFRSRRFKTSLRNFLNFLNPVVIISSYCLQDQRVEVSFLLDCFLAGKRIWLHHFFLQNYMSFEFLGGSPTGLFSQNGNCLAEGSPSPEEEATQMEKSAPPIFLCCQVKILAG